MRATLTLLLLLVTTSASAETYTVGYWNIEWLSANRSRGGTLGKRSDADLKKIGEYIRDELKAKAMMLSEVDSEYDTGGVPKSKSLDAITGHMGADWKYAMGKTGGQQHLAFVYDSSAIEVRKVTEFTVGKFTIQKSDVLFRDPFAVWIRFREGAATKNDLLLIGLHLKAGQNYKDNHLVAMVKIVSEIRKFKSDGGIESDEWDVVIGGDLNDSSHKLSRFRYLFDYMKAKRYHHLTGSGTYPKTRFNGSQIDHVFLSSDLHEEEVDPDSFRVHTDLESKPNFRKTYSDHFPLTFKVEIVDDDD